MDLNLMLEIDRLKLIKKHDEQEAEKKQELKQGWINCRTKVRDRPDLRQGTFQAQVQRRVGNRGAGHFQEDAKAQKG